MAASTNNDDFLSALQLTAVRYLEEDEYFTPPAGVAIPVISEVREDPVQAAKSRGAGGMVCIVGLGDIRFATQGGTRAMDSAQLIVRVREVIGTNRQSSGTNENALRVAQKVAMVLQNQLAAMSTDTTPVHMGGVLALQSIERAEADAPGVTAWHVVFNISGGGIQPFTRRGLRPDDGSP